MKTFRLFVCSLFMAVRAFGQIIHVPADYTTIQLGIDAANPGDTVLVAEGTYFEQINFLGKKPLMVASEFLMDGNTNHIANTIIDGSLAPNPDSASVVNFILGEDTTSVICGFTIQGGKGTYWDLWQSYIGGGIFVMNSSAKILSNIIQNNVLNDTLSTVSWGCCGAGIASAFGYPGWTIIENNRVQSNQVFSKFDWIEGGGIYTYVTNTRIKNNIVIGNLCKNYGYGYAAGGGILIWSDSEAALIIEAEVMDNFIENNEVLASAASAGGGVFAGLANTTFVNNIVNGNKSVHLPPFMGATAYYGGGLEFEYMTVNSLISNNIFSNNICDGLGGAIDIWLPFFANFPIQNNYFTGNNAVLGGAVAVTDSASLVRLVNNVFSHNNATSQGGAIWISRGNGSPEEHMTASVNNAFYDNTSDTTGGAMYVYEDNPVIVNSIFWQNPDLSGNEMVVESGYLEIAYSDIDTTKISGSLITGQGMINVNPLFNDMDKLTIERWSPCVDAGAANYNCFCGENWIAPANDLNNTPRPAGSGFDMGAYEQAYSGVGFHSVGKAELTFLVSPNPFSGFVNFNYTIERDTQVSIFVFDGWGGLVTELVNIAQHPGEHVVNWNTSTLPAGIYYCRLIAGTRVLENKIIKIK